MSEFLAQYHIKAYEVSFGGNLPYEKKEDYCFPASTKERAHDMAEDHCFVIGRELIGATVTLERLLEVKEVSLPK